MKPADLLLVSSAQAGSITDAPRITSVLTNTLQFLLSVVGVIAIIGLVIAGMLYVFALGDEKRMALAKKTTLASILGLVIALGGLVLIGTVAEWLN